MARSALLALLWFTLTPGFGQEAVKQTPAITYEVGWWVYQDGLKVTSARVEKVPNGAGPSPLQPKGEVVITIEGELVGPKGWLPYIPELHLSQQRVRQESEALIVVTPLVNVKSHSPYKGEPIRFVVAKHLPLNMMNWGENLYRFQIGQFNSEIHFQRSK